MATYLSVYLPTLRRVIMDTGVPEHDEYLGNGEEVSFYLPSTPLDDSSIEVYLDGIITADYTIDADSGKLVFDTAPGLDVVIKCLYTSYKYSDNTLMTYLCDAVNESALYLMEDFTLVDDVPNTYIVEDATNMQVRLFIILTQRSMLIDGTIDDAGRAIRWNTDGLIVDRTYIVRDKKEALGVLEKQIHRLLMYDSSQATTRSGGYEPLSAGDCGLSYGESYVIDWAY